MVTRRLHSAQHAKRIGKSEQHQFICVKLTETTHTLSGVSVKTAPYLLSSRSQNEAYDLHKVSQRLGSLAHLDEPVEVGVEAGGAVRLVNLDDGQNLFVRD